MSSTLDVVEVVECTIRGKTYMRDEKLVDNIGTLYNADTHEEVGKFNFKTGDWITRRCTIKREIYMRDEKLVDNIGTVYDSYTHDIEGTYNFKTGKWVTRA
jgi:hypothetical protein